ncbi:O-methyltransferase asqD [Apiospora marii]|uniref:O-methyltransferase asqD n=1 Tax=Apiospora marii TaxID=335849 RepID=UPI00313260CB
MRGVLHDWPDSQARAILANQRTAMKPHHSRLLIQEHTAAHPHATAYELTMMAMVAGVERTGQSWRALLGSAGFRVVKVWSTSFSSQSVIEAEPMTM